MKNQLRKALAMGAAALMMTSMIGCGSTDSASAGEDAGATTEESGSSSEPVEISYATFAVGTHASAGAEAKVLEEFNKQYGDKIKVNVEELPSDDAFVDKMKVLANSKSLPDVCIAKNGIRELAIENGQAVDLIPYLEEDAEWAKFVGEGAIEYNKTDDGKLYSISNQRQIVGYFYNKELFEKAGIQPAKTWDEWMSNCEALKASGVAPLALMTGENCWTTNLVLCSYVGSQGEEGNAFMNTTHPDSYNNDAVISGLEMMQKCLQDYTTSDAVGAAYANAANNFLQENAAIIPNGLWMTSDFSDESKAVAGLADKIGVALYPEDSMISQFEVGYTLNTAGKSEEEQEAALTFLKFITGEWAQGVYLEEAGVLPLTDNVAISDEYKAANPLVADMIELSGQAKYTFENFDNTAYSSVIDEFAVSYPQLVYGEITAEEMAQNLTDAIAENK
ncbi:MAG: extracellular solute-binding protein [Pseudobutyrivibrio sp.]|nr:extracellular solute-binding protein [Pseudobutyrivibrio sp.]